MTHNTEYYNTKYYQVVDLCVMIPIISAVFITYLFIKI